jgi:hypothetical protein
MSRNLPALQRHPVGRRQLKWKELLPAITNQLVGVSDAGKMVVDRARHENNNTFSQPLRLFADQIGVRCRIERQQQDKSVFQLFVC